MELFLAMDLRQNLVVHGKSGQRETYKPLDWGCSPTAEPLGYINTIKPRYLYIADLDRIEGSGSHDTIIRKCAQEVGCCYVDRGCRSPSDLLEGEHIVNIVGTDTGGTDLSRYRGGLLSIDIKDDRVIPSGKDPWKYWNLPGTGILAAVFFSMSALLEQSMELTEDTEKNAKCI